MFFALIWQKKTQYFFTLLQYIASSALADPSGDDVVLDSGKALGSSSSASPQTEEQPQGLTHEAHAESYASPDKKEDPSVKPLPKSNKLRRGGLVECGILI